MPCNLGCEIKIFLSFADFSVILKSLKIKCKSRLGTAESHTQKKKNSPKQVTQLLAEYKYTTAVKLPAFYSLGDVISNYHLLWQWE